MGQYDVLKEAILGFSSLGAAELLEVPEARKAFDEFKQLLNNGLVRAAEKSGSDWVVNSWVKQGILLGMRLGRLQESFLSLDEHGNRFAYIDKDTYPLKKITLANNVRIVPGGSSVRDGSYLAPTVVMMPPAYVNVGAYVDAGTMIDSHALVGSCAQVGKKVHLSAGVQVGAGVTFLVRGSEGGSPFW